MRILTISDIHGQYKDFSLEKLPEADVILVAGDLTNYGMRPPFSYQLQAERELEMARNWFEQLHQHCPRILWVQGNHDIDMPDDFLEPFAQNIRDQTITLLDPTAAPGGLGSLEFDDQSVSVRGVSLTCAFDKPYLAEQWAFTTVNPLADSSAFDFGYHDIIVSHGPPLNCLDRTKFGQHIGSPALQQHVLKHQPKLVVCGHVHEAAGIQALGQSMIVNSARRWHCLTLGTKTSTPLE
jgi:uncharacterized protein